jgi:hypothetical protein
MTISHTDITSEGYVRASVAVQKLACIVRKLPPKRKFNSPLIAIQGADRGMGLDAWRDTTAFPSLLTPHRGSVMVIMGAAGSDHALSG